MRRLSEFRARCTSLFAASALIGASAFVGATYGHKLGSAYSPLLGHVFIMAAIGGAIMAPLAVAAAMDSARSREWVRSLAAIVLACVCLSYNTVAALSLSSMVRSDLAASRAQTTERADIARAARVRAIQELDATPRTGKANVQRRRQLEQTIASADRQLASQPVAIGSADPAAAALTVYLKAATGNEFSASSVGVWLTLIPTIFLELGSALAFIVTRRAAPVFKPTDHPLTADMTSAERQLIDVLKKDGPEAEVSQRSLAERLGLSKTRINQLLASLRSRGVVTAEPGVKGTKLRVV